MNMTKWKRFTIALCLLAIFCLSGCSHVRVDNSAACAELVRHNYNQEDFFTIQAIFNLQRSFHPVSARYLCDYEGLKLECRRSIAVGYDYYVLLDDTIRCFIFVDGGDNVQNVLVVYRFPALQDVQERCSSEKPFDSFPNADDNRVAIDLGSGPSGDMSTVVYFCSGGVVMATYQDNAEPLYTVYTDDEWAQVFSDHGGYQILPIDKQ